VNRFDSDFVLKNIKKELSVFLNDRQKTKVFDSKLSKFLPFLGRTNIYVSKKPIFFSLFLLSGTNSSNI
jgi:hypothetical protein